MRFFRRKPIHGPPLPKIQCGHTGWQYWMRCDLPFGHEGKHGTIVGSNVRQTGFTESTTTVREMWR